MFHREGLSCTFCSPYWFIDLTHSVSLSDYAAGFYEKCRLFLKVVLRFPETNFFLLMEIVAWVCFWDFVLCLMQHPWEVCRCIHTTQRTPPLYTCKHANKHLHSTATDAHPPTQTQPPQHPTHTYIPPTPHTHSPLYIIFISPQYNNIPSLLVCVTNPHQQHSLTPAKSQMAPLTLFSVLLLNGPYRALVKVQYCTI